VSTLTMTLLRRPDRIAMIKERRAATREPMAAACFALSRKLTVLYRDMEKVFSHHGEVVPEGIADGFADVWSALDERIALVTDRLATDPPEPPDSPRNRTRARYAADRRRRDTDRVHHTIADGARTEAIQQRFMPLMRRLVHREVLTALTQSEHTPIRFRGRLIPNRFEDAVHQRASADALTAAYVRSFFPLWGAKTTADVVRKSIRAPRRGR